MKRQLNTKEQWFADTREEAEKIVDESREEFPDELVGYAIQEKSNKSGEYYLVKLDMKFNTPAGIMESELGYAENAEEETEWDEEETEEETTTEDEK